MITPFQDTQSVSSDKNIDLTLMNDESTLQKVCFYLTDIPMLVSQINDMRVIPMWGVKTQGSESSGNDFAGVKSMSWHLVSDFDFWGPFWRENGRGRHAGA